MGGDNAPQKIIDGIELHHKQSKNTFYKLRPDKNGSVYQFAKNINQLDEVDNNHPNKEAHRRWSKLILKFMVNCTFSNTNFEVNEDGTKINDEN